MEYSSFDDVMNQAREWINLKCKDIRTIPKEKIWEFYLAASIVCLWVLGMPYTIKIVNALR